MGTVAFEDVWKVYRDKTVAVRRLNLEIMDGEFFVFLGPSGSGKTSLLRMVAGLDSPTSGDIYIDGKNVTDDATKERNVAMIFQNYSLYPHMTVYQNMAFGIQSRKLKKNEVDERVRRAAAMLELEPLLQKRPRRLSGGQQQRVAMGRAIVRDPSAFLMDEPLSNLDARFRSQLRGEIARIQRELGVTTLYVTHDQNEAMVLGDRVGILRDGKLQQVAPPGGIYRAPENLFVAGFVGSPPMNLAEATVEETDGELFVRFGGHRLPVKNPIQGSRSLRSYAWKQVVVGVRPEDLVNAVGAGAPDEARLKMPVKRREVIGRDVYLYFPMDAPLLLVEDPREAVSEEAADGTWPAEVTNEWMARLDESGVNVGDVVELAIRPGGLYLFDPRTGDIIPQ